MIHELHSNLAIMISGGHEDPIQCTTANITWQLFVVFADLDFGVEDHFLVFFARNTQMCGSISILEDSLVESPETFTVMASGGSFENGQNSVRVLIQDNDGMKTLSISSG